MELREEPEMREPELRRAIFDGHSSDADDHRQRGRVPSSDEGYRNLFSHSSTAPRDLVGSARLDTPRQRECFLLEGGDVVLARYIKRMTDSLDRDTGCNERHSVGVPCSIVDTVTPGLCGGIFQEGV
ncbi:hypothetical protein MTO96_039456 [Rhipicephalus appendiculatus]